MNDVANLCKAVCEEFSNLGFKKDVDPRTLKESFNVVKQADGQWFKSTKAGLHEAATTTLLSLSEMPEFKKMVDLIDELDSEIKKDGGRVFISENIVFKIKKGTQSPLLVAEASDERAPGKYRKLCDEIIEHGLPRDRYRTEETYMLTKSNTGEWSMTSSHENFSGEKKVLEIRKMPLLKGIAMKIGRVDSKFHSNGGRIFVTPTRIYRISNKIETEI